MKTRRFFAVILTCLVLTSVLGVTAFATASKPYTSYSTTISNGLIKDTATATITKCSCSPVNNYLKAGIQVQYKKGDAYYWEPSSSDIYINYGTNVDSRSQSYSVANIVYAYGEFHARCGSGSELTYTKEATN